MKIFKLHTKQKLPITIQAAWDFLSDPKNLKDITPDKMNFNITDCDYKKIYPGQIIQYTVTPLLNIPLNGLLKSLTLLIKNILLMNKDLDHIAFGTINIL